MNIAIRTDASGRIGTGHLMRCLCLANALSVKGHFVHFLCRELPDTQTEALIKSGHRISRLPPPPNGALPPRPEVPWPLTLQNDDATATASILENEPAQWLIVDHYGLGVAWESRMRRCTRRIFAIDDLARLHDCDLLLDQNIYSNKAHRYQGLAPITSKLLLGPEFALLRPEFSIARQYAKPRTGLVQRILVFMGGIDSSNATSHVLEALCYLNNFTPQVDVVIGSNHPMQKTVVALCNQIAAHLYVQTSDMALLCARADLAIGAGGSATWERCVLGLPTLVLTLADNQRELTASAAAHGLVQQASHLSLGDAQFLAKEIQELIENADLRHDMSVQGMVTVDGRGTARVVQALEAYSHS